MDRRILEMCREIDAAKLATAQEGVTAWAEKLLEDAERYRWLQESCCGKNPDITAIIEANEILLDADEMTFEQLDAAIDAAMKKCGK